MILARRPKKPPQGYPMFSLASGAVVLAQECPLLGLLKLLKTESQTEPRFNWFERPLPKKSKIVIKSRHTGEALVGKILGLTGPIMAARWKLRLMGTRPLRVITRHDQSWTVYDARGFPVAGGTPGPGQVEMRKRLKEENKL